MKLHDDFDDFGYEKKSRRMNGAAVFILVSLFILMALSIALVIGKNTKKSNKTSSKSVAGTPAIEEEAEETDEYGMPSTSSLIGDSKLTPDDLDFWDMYSDSKKTGDKTSTDDAAKTTDSTSREKDDSKTSNKTDTDSKTSDKKDSEKNTETTEEEKNLDDGNHTLVTLRDGKTEWVAISPYLTKNTYDLTKFVMSNDVMKYIDDGKTKSFFGTDISKYQGTVNFTQLKNAGVDFVMLKVGGRGYGSGVVTLDENFATNIENAAAAGLDIGLYFYSQAINTQEAIDEANIVLASIGEYVIKYPIAFDMEFVDNDTARIEGLSKADKTTIAKAFMDTISAAGYRTMLYGNKEWLIKEIDLTKLSGYEIWLSQAASVPDYPYKYSMWQYSTSGNVSGINGYANLNICFIDYSNK